MKYVCPAVTVGVRREARNRPVELTKLVPAPQVSMVAGPETAGVHWKTRSGEVPELPQLPACELAPLVVPPKVPPWAGITVGLLQAPDPASVVVVVEVVVGGLVVVVVVVVG